ncbi:MAG TPA: DapH/DapD/GlmU-related protein [Verrucomicrobiae bacterium]
MSEPKAELPYFVHPTAEVATSAVIGTGTKIWHQSQIMGGARIGDNCKLGKSVYVDSGVQIGSNVKIQNGISVYKGVTVEDDVLLGPHMVFTNDLYPRAFNDSYEILPTLVKKGASVGANATIVCGVTLGNYCMVGAGSVVTTDVPDYALVVGNPARVIGYVCACGKRLAVDYKNKRDGQVMCERCGKQFKIEASQISVI